MSDATTVAKRQLGTAKAYRDLFDSPVGRIVLIDLMKKARFLQFSPDDGPYENGQRAIVADILNTFRNRDYDRLLRLIEERVAESPDQE